MKYLTKRSHGLIAAGLLLVIALSSASVFAGGQVASSVDLKFWGRAILNTHYDTDNLRGNTDFATYLSAEGSEEWNFNPRDTRLGFSASHGEGTWKSKAVFEIDFYGDNAGNNLLPRMRLGYMEMSNDSGLSLRAGQDWTPVAVQHPGTIDFGVLSWAGNLWWRVPQITVRKKSGDLTLMGSLMKHRISNARENQEKLPWILGRVEYTGLGDGGMIAVGGGFRSVEVDSFAVMGAEATYEAELDSYTPYLAALEFKLPIGDKLSVNGEAWMGRGIGSHWLRYGFDYNPVLEKEIEAMGGFINATLKATAKTTLNAGYGMDDPEDDDVRTGSPFLKNTVIYGNVKHSLSKHHGLGFEVMHFTTEQSATTELTGQRFTTSMWFVF